MNGCPPLRTVAALAAAALTSAAVAQPHCQPYWRFAHPHFIISFPYIAFDDGSGPAMYFRSGMTVPELLRLRHDGVWESIHNGIAPLSVVHAPITLDAGTGLGLFLAGNTWTPAGREYWLARWDGSTWNQVWPGMHDCTLLAWLVCKTPKLSADLGNGMTIYGVENRSSSNWAIIRWDGTQWVDVGIANREFSLHAFDLGDGPKLYVIGSFTAIAGIASRGMARFDGSTWEDVSHPEFSSGGGGRPSVVYDDGTGPAIYTINHVGHNGQAMPGVKRWRPDRTWEVVGAQALPPNSIPRTYESLHVFDDGAGPALYVTGDFSSINGMPALNFARYDGNGWSTVAQGFVGARRLGSLDMDVGPSLLVTQAAPGASQIPLGQYVGCPNCYANCTRSTSEPLLTVDDFTCFIDEFAHALTMEPRNQINHYANCTANTTEPILTVDDFMCFINRFAQGCK